MPLLKTVTARLLIIFDKVVCMVEEIWKDMIGYEEYFKVSNLGNIYSKRTNRLLKLTKSKTGYLCFSTRLGGRNSKAVLFRVHREVAKAFIPVPDNLIGYENNNYYGIIPVNHIDGNKLNNVVSNLEWVTHKENTQHAMNTGLISIEEKLTQEQISYILENYDPNNKKFYGESALSKHLNCSRYYISKILVQYKLKQ